MLAARSTPILNSNFTKLHRRRFIGDEVSRNLTIKGRSALMTLTAKPTATNLNSMGGVGVITLRAVVNSGDSTVIFPPGTSAPAEIEIKVKATVLIRKKMREGVVEKLERLAHSFFYGVDQNIWIQLISEEVDHATGSAKVAKSYVRPCEAISTDQSSVAEYTAEFSVPKDFGKPGAILITNNHGKEFYLEEIILGNLNGSSFVFPAYSWIQPRSISYDRIFFTNEAYLPSQTPPGIMELRQGELRAKRGEREGESERKLHERIYDYAPYNDLGDPAKKKLSRPVLAGEERPYPRRCRTGRPAAVSGSECESRGHKWNRFYVPRDEHFEEIKNMNFSNGELRGYIRNMWHAATLVKLDLPFNCFSDVDNLYNHGNEEHRTNLLFRKIMIYLSRIFSKLLKYDVPHIIQRDRFAWWRNIEFGRQALAGVNPVSIELLKEFPIISKLDPAIYGPPESAITKEVLEEKLNGMSVEEAIKCKRLFIIDYHDLILPFVNKIDSLKHRKCYASRTIFYLCKSGVLKPVAIELARPAHSATSSFKRVYTQGHTHTARWQWIQAKAHVCAVDGAVHQVIHHWLRTHACMEPYIIATHRHLSILHPIFKLLHPHMRYTMDINSRARKSLISGGGIIEATFTPGEFAMEISSAAYKKQWRFDMEALPADLIRRGMAEEDPSSKYGIKLVIEDYPYAADGILIWSAIEEWVKSYVSHFYSDSNAVSSDVELQNWWDEIKNKGHPDKRNAPGWPVLETKEDLMSIITIMIWIASGQHAAINFGQYPFGGYVPSRPTLMRKLIPREDDPECDEAEYNKFLQNPQQYFLNSLPTQLQATRVMAIQEILSTHSEDEEYLGNLRRNLFNDEAVLKMHDKFSRSMKKIEDIIHKRNTDRSNKIRTGAGIPPYELLLPSSDPGVTGRGIPNSISI